MTWGRVRRAVARLPGKRAPPDAAAVAAPALPPAQGGKSLKLLRAQELLDTNDFSLSAETVTRRAPRPPAQSRLAAPP